MFHDRPRKIFFTDVRGRVRHIVVGRRTRPLIDGLARCDLPNFSIVTAFAEVTSSKFDWVF